MKSTEQRFDADAFILAGGASSRMGRNKSLLDFGGVPLILRTVQIVRPLVRTITVVGAPERYASLGLRTMPDRDFGMVKAGEASPGPLAGIATALTGARAPWNLILGCDLPFLTQAWLAWLLARAQHSHALAVLPRSARGLEPLAGVYRSESVEPLEQALRDGVRRVTDALGRLSVEAIAESEWREFDPHGRILRNMNTPADYDEARRWLESAEAAPKDAKSNASAAERRS